MENSTIIIKANNSIEAEMKAEKLLGITSSELHYRIISADNGMVTIEARKKTENELEHMYSNTVYLPPKIDTEPTQVKCPKCGSTQIQMVPRKWSLLTGFFTNKVDRVCVNCKHKF